MKKRSLYSLLILLLIFIVNSAFAADDSNQTDEEQCQAYAKEDGIPAAELADYIKECMESLKGESADTKEKSE